MAAPVSAGGALVFRFGYFLPAGGGDLWARNTELFELEVADFNYFMGGVELGIELSPFVDFTLGIDGYSRLVEAPYRDLVRQDGKDIAQSLWLKAVPITGGIRLFPTGKLHWLVPYVAIGGGVIRTVYQESGSAVDPQSLVILPRDASFSRFSAGGYASAGLEVLTMRGVETGHGWYAFIDYRMTRHASGIENSNVRGGLSGRQIQVGLTVRY